MYVVTANTYLSSYGSEIHLFYIGKTKQDCIKYMKDYNKNSKELEDFIATKLPDDKRPWELSDEDRATWESLIAKYTTDEYSYRDGIFKFEEDSLDSYIDEFDNGNPLFLGGYCE